MSNKSKKKKGVAMSLSDFHAHVEETTPASSSSTGGQLNTNNALSWAEEMDRIAESEF
jgi:hypothetical protein